MTKFTDFGLTEPLLRALEQAGYETPTPIQAQAIPSVLEGRDLLGIAQTGTGKTAAFALPILHRLVTNKRRAPRKGCRALILSPTRELASQIAENFQAYACHLDLSVATIFGGVGYRPQVQKLARGVDVLIAAPGRLLDLIGSGNADLSGTEIFVLDEADQMLDLGFLPPIRKIAGQLSQRRQTLLFSATMPKEIAGLADSFLRRPVKVEVTPAATTVERVAQRIVFVDKAKKVALLGDVLGGDEMHRALVFTRTKRGADRVAKHLARMDFDVAAIHGNKSQNQRERTLHDFKQSKIQILVATDIAARGIDVDGITHVVNYDFPDVPEAYVHRIGRTARAGASGVAVSFCSNDDVDLLRAVEKVTGQRIVREDRRNDDALEELSDGQKDRRKRVSRGAGRRGGQAAAGRRKRPAKRGAAADGAAKAAGEPRPYDPLAAKPEGRPGKRRRPNAQRSEPKRDGTVAGVTAAAARVGRDDAPQGPKDQRSRDASKRSQTRSQANGYAPRKRQPPGDGTDRKPGRSSSKGGASRNVTANDNPGRGRRRKGGQGGNRRTKPGRPSGAPARAAV